jgi:hypothetical protein
VVVVVGLTVTGTPLVAERLPGVMTPVPFENTPVRIVLWPAVMELGLATKLVIFGAGSTVTMRACAMGLPVVGVTVTV